MRDHSFFSDENNSTSSKPTKLYAGILVGLFFLGLLLFHFLYTKKESTCAKSKTDTRLPAVVILAEVLNFGSNPGNLWMYHYVPRKLKKNMPLVIALHGCTQTAVDYALLSGWNRLADRHGFIMVYAEQKESNNIRNCFNWPYQGDIFRGKGEAKSIYQMVKYMTEKYPVDTKKIFVTGLSAGGAMTMVMLSAYPDIFHAGAVMAGLPYSGGKIQSWGEAYSLLDGDWNLPSKTWVSFVKKAYPGYKGTYPKLVVMHGKKDKRVNFKNMNLIVKQWTALHETDNVPDKKQNLRGAKVKKYRGKNSRVILETYSFPDMGHAIAVDPGDGKEQGGYLTYMGHTEDQNFFSSYWVGVFWGIIEE